MITAEFRKIQMPESLVLDQDTAEIPPQGTLELTAEPVPATTSEHVIWISDDPTIAEVDHRGKVTAVSPGTTTIHAVCGEWEQTCKVVIPEVKVSGIHLITPVYLEGIGITENMAAVITPDNATEKITWTSSDTNVVTIDADGNLTTVSTGSAVIRAEADEVYAEAQVYVTAAPERVRLSSGTLTLERGGQPGQLTLSVSPGTISPAMDIEWFYDSEKLEAEISGDAGEMIKLTPVGVGTTMVEAQLTYNGISFTDSCVVSIEAPARSLRLNTGNVSLLNGEGKQLEYTVDPSDTTSKITWESSNTSIVSVSSNGYVNGYNTGLKAQSAVVTAKTDNGLSASCTVTVKPVPATGLTLSDTAITIQNGRSVYLNYSIEPYNSTSQVSITSSNTDIVSVSGSYLYGYNEGTAPVSATVTVRTDNGIQRTCTVTVMPSLTVVNKVEDLQSSHNYENSMDMSWLYTAKCVEKMAVTFSDDTETESGYDYITIQDKQGNEIGRYSGTELAGQTVTITGDTIRINLHSDGSVNRYGFRVTNIKTSGIRHSFGAWTTSKAATCTQAGQQKRTCTVCGKAETRSIAAKGHGWNAWTTSKAATCTQAGQQKRTCKLCGKAETRSIAAKGHSWNAWKLTRKPTVLVAGVETRTCKNNSSHKQTRSVRKLAASLELTVGAVNIAGQKLPMKTKQKFSKITAKMGIGDVIEKVSSDNAGVTVSFSGNTITVKAGKKKVKKATIAVQTKGGAKKTFTVQVTKKKLLAKKAVNFPKKLTIKVGETKDMGIYILPVTVTDKLKFSSSAKKVVKVNKKTGVLTAKKKGKAVITLKVGKKTFKCKVTVKK